MPTIKKKNVICLLVSFLTACTIQKPLSSIPAVAPPITARSEPLAIFMGDNQERELFGESTGLSASEAQRTTGVAIRSSEQDLFEKYILASIIHGNQSSEIFHLGDVLDYSCESEWNSVTDVLSTDDWKRIYMVPGNHDGLFQGNNNYGLLFRIALFLQGKDSSLQGHNKAVCNPRWTNVNGTGEDPNFRKRDFVCAYIDQLKNAGANFPDDVISSCGLVSQARKQRFESAPDVVIKRSDLQAIARPSDTATLSLASRFTGSSTDQWSKGYLLQAVEIPARDSKFPGVHVILMDSTDWAGEPEYDFLSKTDNSSFGNFSQRQRDAVKRYLQNVPAGALIVLSSHYPIKDLDDDPKTWLMNTVAETKARGNKLVYLSAHTHRGYVEIHRLPGDNEHLTEINLDSIIDWPVSFWELRLEGGAFCFTPRSAWEALGCEGTMKDQILPLSSRIVSYRDHMASGAFDLGEKQWRHRAKDACRLMNSYGLPGGSTCSTIDFVNDGMATIGKGMTLARKSFDHFLAQTPDLQRRAACASMVGAANFTEEPKPERAEYKTICVQE